MNEHDRIGEVVCANPLRFLVSRLRTKDRDRDVVMLVDEPGDQ